MYSTYSTFVVILESKISRLLLHRCTPSATIQSPELDTTEDETRASISTKSSGKGYIMPSYLAPLSPSSLSTHNHTHQLSTNLSLVREKHLQLHQIAINMRFTLACLAALASSTAAYMINTPMGGDRIYLQAGTTITWTPVV